MPTERLEAANPAHITRAAKLLREGGTVAFPTETVYGLGASALNPVALEKIFLAKQRPHWDPLIVHIADFGMLDLVAELNSRTARQLMNRFWPGPLTILLPRMSNVPDAVTAGRPLVGVRMPAHPVAHDLIRQAGVPIAAPSANTFGHTSPTTAQHVLDDLDGRIDAVLDGGPTEVGIESTVVGIKWTAEEPWDRAVIYRTGGITLATLEAELGIGAVELYFAPAQTSVPESLPSPGVGMRHYAPQARVILVSSDPHSASFVEETLVSSVDEATIESSRVAVMLPHRWNPSAADMRYPWGPWHDHNILAHRLYDGLRTLDDAGATVIVCPVPQGDGIAEAIRDRLQKAAK